MRESADREQRQDRNSSRVSVARVSSSGPKRVLGSLQWKCTTLKKLHNDYNKVLKKIDSRLWVKKKSAAHERLNTLQFAGEMRGWYKNVVSLCFLIVPQKPQKQATVETDFQSAERLNFTERKRKLVKTGELWNQKSYKQKERKMKRHKRSKLLVFAIEEHCFVTSYKKKKEEREVPL